MILGYGGNLMDSKLCLQHLEDNHIPKLCPECQGVMVFQGVGEYKCENCGRLDYDDYGKVRNYIEAHPGTSTGAVEAQTGVSQRAILRMLREGRFMLTEDCRTKLHCDICGKTIRFGRLCEDCERSVHRMLEEEQRRTRSKDVRGYGRSNTVEEGLKRFVRGEE